MKDQPSYESDIPTSTAQAAHDGTSFSPEKRAQTERESYSSHLVELRGWMDKVAKKHSTTHLVDAEFDRYRDRYKALYLGYLHSRHGMMSTMITGGSNFPQRAQEKKHDRAHKKLGELLEAPKLWRAKILRTLTPLLQPIKSSDDDACERLREKIAKAEKNQADYKACNAAIRKHKKAGTEAQVAALAEIGIRGTTARGLLTPDYGRPGVPSYMLTNNNANIRRMKQRLEQIQAAQATPTTEAEGEDGISFEDNPADNRVRLFFPGKPEASMRSALKSSGFRWAPSIGAWQAYRNRGTIEFAKIQAGLIEPTANQGTYS